MSSKVLILADSTALPRDEICYEDTWIAKLVEAHPEKIFINKSVRGATTELLNGLPCFSSGKNDVLEYYEPDTVILNLGIVDCAPRLFKRGSIEKKFLSTIAPKGLKYIYIYQFSEDVKNSFT